MEITLRHTDNCALVSINGRIDSYTAPVLSEKLTEITSQNLFNIVLDLSDISFVSSAGLRIFIDIQKTCKRNGGEVVFVNVPQRVYETLELAGFAQLFKFFNDVNSAIKAF